MEIFIDIWVEDRESGNKKNQSQRSNTYLVAVDDTGRP
jgi:acyl-CoA hydrolase